MPLLRHSRFFAHWLAGFGFEVAVFVGFVLLLFAVGTLITLIV